MTKVQRRIKTKRVFSQTLKQQAVKEYESGKYTVKTLSKLYGISAQSVYNWIYKYSPAWRPLQTARYTGL